jgi:predicted RNase H-like HicB family nuclease
LKACREFTVVIERDEKGWFAARVPELPGWHTKAKGIVTLLERAREVMWLCIDDSSVTSGT